MQVSVQGADEQGSPGHDALRDADDLAGAAGDRGRPALGPAGGARRAPAPTGPTAGVAYVCSDGGALPLAFSRTVAGLREAGWLIGSVTTGQAYGGDLEAVTVHTGLLAARHLLAADVVVVTQGPGNLGTGTRFGFSGVAAARRSTPSLCWVDARWRRCGCPGRTPGSGTRASAITRSPRTDGSRSPLPTVLPLLGGYATFQGWALSSPSRRRRWAAVTGWWRCSVEGLLDALGAAPVRLSTMGRDLWATLAHSWQRPLPAAHAASLLA